MVINILISHMRNPSPEISSNVFESICLVVFIAESRTQSLRLILLLKVLCTSS